jgi:hypothetical protein
MEWCETFNRISDSIDLRAPFAETPPGVSDRVGAPQSARLAKSDDTQRIVRWAERCVAAASHEELAEILAEAGDLADTVRLIFGKQQEYASRHIPINELQKQLLQTVTKEGVGLQSSYWPLRLEIDRQDRHPSSNGSRSQPEQPASRPPQKAMRDTSERLAEVTRLHDSGLLSDEEYQTKRAQIINEI